MTEHNGTDGTSFIRAILQTHTQRNAHGTYTEQSMFLTILGLLPPATSISDCLRDACSMKRAAH